MKFTEYVRQCLCNWVHSSVSKTSDVTFDSCHSFTDVSTKNDWKSDLSCIQPTSLHQISCNTRWTTDASSVRWYLRISCIITLQLASTKHPCKTAASPAVRHTHTHTHTKHNTRSHNDVLCSHFPSQQKDEASVSSTNADLTVCLRNKRPSLVCFPLCDRFFTFSRCSLLCISSFFCFHTSPIDFCLSKLNRQEKIILSSFQTDAHTYYKPQRWSSWQPAHQQERIKDEGSERTGAYLFFAVLCLYTLQGQGWPFVWRADELTDDYKG